MKLFKRTFLILPVLFLILTCSKDDDPEMFILSVTISPEEGGSVSPDGGTFDDGTVITLTATPSEGYVFREWMGDLESTQNPVSASMDSDMNITLVFVKADEDSDGVSDDVDQCLNTPEGEEVDENGCSSSQIDSDGDGVSDDSDLCGNTPEGEDVDDQGCPLTPPVYLDENGVTIKAYEWAEVGQIGLIDGIAYTIVDETILREMVQSGEDVSKVCTSRVTDMSQLFFLSSFNDDIGSWDVSHVTNMSRMFAGFPMEQRNPFNRDISYWDTGSVTDMSAMFLYSIFDQKIGSWDVGNVTDMGGMFSLSLFNQEIGNWNVSRVTDMGTMFAASQFNQDISGWDVGSVADLRSMFAASQFNQDISNWNVQAATDMSHMFAASQFNQDISSWNVQAATDMSHMFDQSLNFNQDLSGWNVDNVIACERFSFLTPLWTLPKPNFTNCNPD